MWQLIFGAVMISFSAVFVRLVSVPPTVSAFYRMAFGGAILLLILLWRRERPRLGLRGFLVLALAAAFFATDLLLWHRSILYLGPGVGTLLPNFQVFILAAVGVLFFKEHLAWHRLLAIVLAILGLALLVGTGWSRLPPSYHLGVVLGLATACAYAGYLLTLRGIQSSGEAGSTFTVMTVLSLTVAAMLAAAVGVEGESFAIPAWSDAGWLFLYGLVPQVLGWLMISNAMPRVGTAQVGLVLLLQPSFAFVWDVLFFGRRFGTAEMAGAVLALVSIYMGSLKKLPFRKQAA